MLHKQSVWRLKERPELNSARNRGSVAIIARSFLGANGLIKRGGAERVLLWIAQFLLSTDRRVVVFQRGINDDVYHVNGIEVRTVACRKHQWSRSLSNKALENGAKVLIFQDLSIVVRVAQVQSIIGLNHGVYWDYPVLRNLKTWYPFHFLPYPLMKIFITLWRRFAKHRELRGVAISDLTVAFDTGLLRLIQSDAPNDRDKIRVVTPYSDLVDLSLRDATHTEPSQDSTELAKNCEWTILVPRNQSLSSGLFWLKDVALELVSQVPATDWKIVVAGKIGQTEDSTESLIESLKGSGLAKYSEISGNLYFLGSLDREELKRAYLDATVVLIPTFAYEGACLSAVEAISMSKAVVATNVGGLNDTITNDWNGVLCNPNPKSIANGVAKVLLNSQYRMELEEGARESSRLYTFDNWTSRWASICEELGF